MTEFTLHCFAQSGNAYKAALMLNLCGADWEPHFVEFFKGETRTPEFRENVNEMGEAPVLVHGDVTLSQSGVILDYLSGHFGKFGPENEDERREILRWILFDNHKFTSYIGTYRFLTRFMNVESPVTEFLSGRMHASFGILEKHLAAADFVVANRPTTADISLCGYLYYDGEIAGLDWAAYPNVKAWIERIKQLDGWAHPYDLMPGHPLPESDK